MKIHFVLLFFICAYAQATFPPPIEGGSLDVKVVIEGQSVSLAFDYLPPTGANTRAAIVADVRQLSVGLQTRRSSFAPATVEFEIKGEGGNVEGRPVYSKITFTSSGGPGMPSSYLLTAIPEKESLPTVTMGGDHYRSSMFYDSRFEGFREAASLRKAPANRGFVYDVRTHIFGYPAGTGAAIGGPDYSEYTFISHQVINVYPELLSPFYRISEGSRARMFPGNVIKYIGTPSLIRESDVDSTMVLQAFSFLEWEGLNGTIGKVVKDVRTGGYHETITTISAEHAFTKLKTLSETAVAPSVVGFNSAVPAIASVTETTSSVAMTKVFYKLKPYFSTFPQTLLWWETFTPEGENTPTDYRMMSWDAPAGAEESPVYEINPFEAANPNRFGALPGTYQVQLIDAGLVVDVDRDSRITPNAAPYTFLTPDKIDVTTSTEPFRFWSNDDDDQGPAIGENMPGQPAGEADYNNAVVDSVRDLVDFFPVYLDLKQLLTVLPPSASVKYKLKQADGALNFVYTNVSTEYSADKRRSKAFDYQYEILSSGFGPAFTQGAGEATTQQITAAGVDLTEFGTAFLDGIKNNDWGVILVEGRTATDKPLVLSVEKADGTAITEVKLHLKISPVEQMYRHIDLTTQVKEYASYGTGSYIIPPKAGVPTQTAQPTGYHDSLTNGKYFIFVHGFNVDADSARGWNAEVFKRMHAMGSKARFVGVQWNGSPPSLIPGKYLDYHKAVFQAFQTGDLLTGALSFTGGADVTIAAHSLGNIVVSHAIQNRSLVPTRYYMINTAAAIEAYSLSDAAGEFNVMRHEHWVPYETRLYAAKWHERFASSDNRNALTWKLRFENVVLTTGLAHNFFSGEEDVVADADQIDDASILEVIFQGNLPAVMTGEYSWKMQELAKGANVLSSAAAAALERRQGGWGFSTEWNILEDVDPGPGSNWQSHRRPPSQTGQETPVPPGEIPSEGLKTKPFFRRFLEPELMGTDATAASNKAGENKVKYDLLARAIPAMSNAVAANRLDSLGDNNYNMPGDAKRNGWHDADNRWKHSDFCNVALPYVYPMFQEMISRGGLNQ